MCGVYSVIVCVSCFIRVQYFMRCVVSYMGRSRVGGVLSVDTGCISLYGVYHVMLGVVCYMGCIIYMGRSMLCGVQ